VAAPWVSFDEVKAQVSIEDVLRRYGFFDSLQHKGSQLVGLCPFHKESKPSFKVTPAPRNLWHCFGCKRGGDVIDFVCVAEDIATGRRTSNRRQAALLLQDWFGIVAEQEAPAQHQDTATPPAHGERATQQGGEAAAQDPAAAAIVNPPLGFTLKNLDYEQAYAYAETRGITRATAEQFGLAVALAGGFKGRLVIPLIDSQDGQDVLVGYAARSLDESEPKYLFPSREKGFYKSHLVFNLARVRGQKAAVVTEGFFDCMKVTQAGFPAVALMGCDISDQQARDPLHPLRALSALPRW
jgi:DNA primase